MLRGGIPIGKVFGIQIRLHYSWFAIFALVTWALAASYFPLNYPGWTLTAKVAVGFVTSILFFGSVLVHELAHSLVAQHQGIKVESITLFILGGVSQITQEPKQAGQEFRMAFAGPLTSLIIGAIFYWIIYPQTLHSTGFAQYVNGISYWLGWVNLLLGAFNLVPGFPLDGGRVFRSIVWGATNNLRKATRIASDTGRAIGYLFIFAGIVQIFTDRLSFILGSGWFGGIWIALIGWFLESAASGSYRQLALQEILQGHTVSEIMTRDCLMVSPDISVEKLVNENVLTSGRRCFPVVSDGRALGLVTLHNIKAVPRETWASKKVRDIMTSSDALKWVSPTDELTRVLQMMTESDIAQVPVIQDNTIVGMVGRDNLMNFIELRSNLGA
jgi:Zn-dependent protease/predicted transcriptional regulator